MSKMKGNHVEEPGNGEAVQFGKEAMKTQRDGIAIVVIYFVILPMLYDWSPASNVALKCTSAAIPSSSLMICMLTFSKSFKILRRSFSSNCNSF